MIADVLTQVKDEFSSDRDFVFFLFSPNSYLDNRRPVELLDVDPSRLIGLARAFVHPADPF
jgi:uncharacterized protein (DUF2384 family)